MVFFNSHIYIFKMRFYLTEKSKELDEVES